MPDCEFTFTVRATGYWFDHVVNVTDFCPAGAVTCASYVAPGVSCTSEPRHSLLRESNQSGKPSRHVASPAFRNLMAQPAAPGFAGGVQ